MWVFQVPDNVSPADRRQGGMSTLQVNDAPAVCTYSSTSNEQFCVDVGSGHLVHGLVQPEPGTGLVVPPVHPHCRCSMRPILDDEV